MATRATTPTSHFIGISLFRRVSRVDDDVLDFADAVATAMLGGVAVLLRFEALDGLLEARERDDDMAVKVFGALHLPIAAAAREDFRAVFLEDLRERIRVFLVFDGVVDFCVRNPVSGHGPRLYFRGVMNRRPRCVVAVLVGLLAACRAAPAPPAPEVKPVTAAPANVTDISEESIPLDQVSKSQAGAIGQRVATTEITLTYSRPVARGRQLFGALVPYGQVWTPGADQATAG